MSEEFEDASDYLRDLQNKRVASPERLLLFHVIWQCYVDLSHPSYRPACLIFIGSEHFQRTCELLELTPTLVRDAMLAKPFRATVTRRGGVKGPRKRKPIQWAATFNSRETGAIQSCQQ
jgi:hypothetical protein